MPKGSYFEHNHCIVNNAHCISGTVQEEDGITCSPLNPNLSHYNIPRNGGRNMSSSVDQLPDGSCPEGYHYQFSPDTSIQKRCLINVIQKNPDGSCPGGLVLNTYEECVKIPVYPGSHTGSNGGGFVQMFPESPPATKPPATSPSKTSQYLPPPVVK
jgi:hypothetical protein